MFERQKLAIDAPGGVGGDRRPQAEPPPRLLRQQGRARAGVEQGYEVLSVHPDGEQRLPRRRDRERDDGHPWSKRRCRGAACARFIQAQPTGCGLQVQVIARQQRRPQEPGQHGGEFRERREVGDGRGRGRQLHSAQLHAFEHHDRRLPGTARADDRNGAWQDRQAQRHGGARQNQMSLGAGVQQEADRRRADAGRDDREILDDPQPHLRPAFEPAGGVGD